VAYCPPELLDDLADVLALVRSWADVVEKKPHVFYARRQPFLHFHQLADGRRRADMKGRAGWVQLDVPRPISAARRRALVRELNKIHAEVASAAPRPSPR